MEAGKGDWEKRMKKRYTLLDVVRGFTLISMIFYHTIWDMVYMFDVRMPWFQSEAAFVWQQSICWTFILLSGFCWSLGRRKLRRALLVLGASGVISLVTLFVTPESRILFGVLNGIGTGMLLMIPLDKVLCKCSPYAGAVISFGLFLLTRNVNDGSLGFGNLKLVSLPEGWYANLFTAYLGFPEPGFYSSDYFAVFPWIFLYITGYFLYGIFQKRDWLRHLRVSCMPLEWLGSRSLIIYLLHQPIVYGMLCILL